MKSIKVISLSLRCDQRSLNTPHKTTKNYDLRIIISFIFHYLIVLNSSYVATSFDLPATNINDHTTPEQAKEIAMAEFTRIINNIL
jgi:hypothetical protein